MAAATRRYAESEIFGLYAPTDTSKSNVTNTEALSIYSEFSQKTGGQTNRSIAFSYENTWVNHRGKNNKIVSAIDRANDTLSSQEIQQYAPAVSGTVVQALEGELNWADTELNNRYITDTSLNPWATGFTATVDSLDIQVAASGGGSDLVASKRNGYHLGVGNYMPSLLIAQDGDDTLDGSGSAADALIGSVGAGNDTFYVGSGNDYIVAGSGDDVIEGDSQGGAIGGGNDTIVLGASNTAMGGNDTVWTGAGNDTIYVAKSNNDDIHLSPNRGMAEICPKTLTWRLSYCFK
ncbi:hypothetical protein [Dyella acidisoli]|nr:hypothetical protein [Dyella acidisoli]